MGEFDEKLPDEGRVRFSIEPLFGSDTMGKGVSYDGAIVSAMTGFIDDIMVAILLSSSCMLEPDELRTLRSACATAPAFIKRSSRFFAVAVCIILSTAGGIAGFNWCNNGNGSCICLATIAKGVFPLNGAAPLSI